MTKKATPVEKVAGSAKSTKRAKREVSFTELCSVAASGRTRDTDWVCENLLLSNKLLCSAGYILPD